MLAGAVTAVASPTIVLAQAPPVEGRQYVKLNKPVSTRAPAGKFEVIEFFWYGCPHCSAFEPRLQSWVARLPADVLFDRVPVAFRAEPFSTHQRLYYALDRLGLVGAMQRKVFHAIHEGRQRLADPSEISAFMAKNGVDVAQFMQAFEAATPQLEQANRLVDGYKIDGVPAMGIHGRFYTSGALAGGNEHALTVTDALIATLRKGG